jgi:tetratricopeptide (TPR) repeat protein
MADLRALYREAFGAFARGDYEAAIAGYRRALEQDPRFALACQGLAEAHARAGQLELAVEAIRRAIALEPGEPLYQTSLSRFLQQLGRIPEAEAAAAAAARLQSKPTL